MKERSNLAQKKHYKWVVKLKCFRFAATECIIMCSEKKKRYNEITSYFYVM